MPVIPAVGKAKMRGFQVEASWGDKLVRLYLKKQAGHGGSFL
jgi:hypothetical protein